MAETGDEEKSVETLLADVQKRISEAFDLFDHESNKTIDVREVGTVVRSLGCVPTEAELHDILAEVEEEESTGYIRYERFEPVMTKILMERQYQPSSEEHLLKAFQILDKEDKNYLLADDLTKYLTEHGEPFSQEEIEEMLSAAVDPEKGVIMYKEFVTLMSAEEHAS